MALFESLVPYRTVHPAVERALGATDIDDSTGAVPDWPAADIAPIVSLASAVPAVDVRVFTSDARLGLRACSSFLETASIRFEDETLGARLEGSLRTASVGNKIRLVVVGAHDVDRYATALDAFQQYDGSSWLLVGFSLTPAARRFLDAAAVSGWTVHHLPSAAGAALVERTASARNTGTDVLETWREWITDVAQGPERLRAVVRNETLLRSIEAGSLAAVDAGSRLVDTMVSRMQALVDRTVRDLHTATLEVEDAPRPASGMSPAAWIESVLSWTAAAGGRERRTGRIVSALAGPELVRFADALRRVRDEAATCLGPNSRIDSGDRGAELLRSLPVTLHALEALERVAEIAYWSRNWTITGNETWSLCTDDTLAEPPHPMAVRRMAEYDDLYRLQSLETAAGFVPAARESVDDRAPSEHRPILAHAQGPTNHVLRQHQAASLVEFLATMLHRTDPHEHITWLDVGCGLGSIANAPDLERFTDGKFDVVGIDVSKGNVDTAQRRAPRGRRFLQASANELPTAIRERTFRIVSAFEFLEHLEDPVSLIREYGKRCSDFFLAGSPLAEGRSSKPHKSHLWSFTRDSYEALFRKAGFEITMSSELRIGSYIGGFDWLFVAAAKPGRRLQRRLG